MSQIHNSELIKELQDAAKLQPSSDIIPNQLAEKVVPVMEVNPKMMRRSNVFKWGSKNVTGTSVLYAVPADKDFYLTAITLSNSSSVLADNTSVYIQFTTTDGVTTNYWVMSKPALTAYTNMESLGLSFPLQIKSGTSILFGSSFTVGASVTEASIFGFTVDNPRA